MKDLFTIIAKSIPAFLSALLKVLMQPKRFLVAEASDQEHGLSRSLTFGAVTLGLSVLFGSPFLGDNLFATAMMFGVMSLLVLIAYLVAVNVAWKLARGRATPQENAVVYIYQASVLVLLIPIKTAAVVGALRSHPYLMDEFGSVEEATLAGGVSWRLVGDDTAATFLAAFSVGALAVALMWTVLTWGAYRTINRASRGQSVIAFVLACVFSFPLNIATNMLGILLSQIT